ncbi:MAG: PQQ-binding-like beta-propeller repeat protein [Planctomycetaceae bacterium]|nr:PQQ-binding-like beta-propeller repeat protein [Planctomycetaceae bacterium]
MPALRLLLCGLFLSWGAPPDGADAAQWPRFRGPNGAGVTPESRIPITWKDENCLWRTDLPGHGHSSPVIWGDRLFVTCADERTGDRTIGALRLDRGDIEWTRTFPAASHATHELNSLASATPTADERHVYIAWGTPDEIKVVALRHDGEVAWESDLGPYIAGHGFGQSLVLHGERLVLPVEKGEGSFRAALRCDDGSVDWKVPCESALHYATPCVRSTTAGDELVFVNWEHGIAGVDPTTGQPNWAADVFDKEHIEASIASPVLAGNLVIGVSGYLGHGYEAVAVDPERKGDKVAWRLDRGAPLCTTPLVVNGLVIFWADNGVVTCVEAATGAVHWRERIGGNFYSSPIAAGNAIYNISTDGEMIVLAADRAFAELARNPLPEASHATPAVLGDRMYVRTFSQMLCIGAAP